MNKWIKVLIIFLVALNSYSITNLLLSSFPGILRVFIDYSAMLIAIFLTCMFVFKISMKETLEKFGLMRKNLFNSMIISLIFTAAIVLFNLIIYLLNNYNLLPYFSSVSNYLFGISTSFSGYSLCLVFLFGAFLQIYAAFIEEFIFRGLMINTLDGGRIFGPFIAVFFSAVLFSAWHLDSNIGMFLGKFVLGLLFGACFIASGKNSAGSGILHSISNLWYPANALFLFYLN